MSSNRARWIRAAASLGLAVGCTAGLAAVPAAALPDVAPPTVPQNLRTNASARPGNNVVLTWDASTDDSGRINHYWVFVDGQQRARPAATRYDVQVLVDLGRITKGQHKITVQAVDWALNRSAQSSAIEITVT